MDPADLGSPDPGGLRNGRDTVIYWDSYCMRKMKEVNMSDLIVLVIGVIIGFVIYYFIMGWIQLLKGKNNYMDREE